MWRNDLEKDVDIKENTNLDIKLNKDIVLENDSYYMYKVPLFLSGPGKLIKVNSEEDFRKYESKRVILDILSVIGVLLLIIIIGMFC